MIDSVDQDQCARQVFSSQLTIGFTRSADATGIECRSEVEVTAPESDGLLRTLSNVVVNLSRDGERDLIFRQLAVFLICCTEAGGPDRKRIVGRARDFGAGDGTSGRTFDTGWYAVAEAEPG
jgi:hypothetical protein